MHMKALRLSTWLAWSPLLCVFGFSAIYEYLPQNLTCQVINPPDGKEFVCGGTYEHVVVQAAEYVMRGLCLCLVGVTCFMAATRKLSPIGWTGFALTLTLAIWASYFIWARRNDCFP
jgi:hypothetical protein